MVVGETTNQRRARRARRIVENYKHPLLLNLDYSPEEAITDLMIDLLHLTASEGLNVGDMI